MYRGELTNSISHLVGAVLAFAGMVLLTVFSAFSHDPWKLGSALVYGLTLLLMFVFSTLYHSLRGTPKAVFQRFDHISIYLLIAGTYTPYCLVVLREDTGWTILAIVWSVALFGTVFKSVFGARFTRASTLLYVAAGWTILPELDTLRARLDPTGFALLVAGGVLYTAGAVFYLRERMPWSHEIWHFFVLAAAGCHFMSVLLYVVA